MDTQARRPPQIDFVNHASFIVDTGDARLITDPWLFGSAFDNGWDLLCESPFTTEDFGTVTHIWFSHEHPDHFSPPVLKKIPDNIRSDLTVVYQKTRDGKVADYCRSLGFSVVELPDAEPVRITERLTLTCGAVPFIDSWILFDLNGYKILNTNDCVVDGDAIASEIKAVTGPVDVLFTQFSYANWVGNPDETHLRRESALEKLDRVRLQIEMFRPAYTVPFASFVYFSHEENVYLNDGINTVMDAAEFIRNKTDSVPVVLYPGDTWIPGTDHDNGPALERYAAEYATLAEKPLRTSVSVSMADLQTQALAYLRRVHAANSSGMIAAMAAAPVRYFPTVRMHLTDLDRTVEFDLRRGLREIPFGAPDIELSSESLSYVFRFDWGEDTLLVNGRFRASEDGVEKFRRTFGLGRINNNGHYLHPKMLMDGVFMKRAVAKVLGRLGR